nr:hypothetical protein CFP56_44435 [Quercus suber]
MKSTQEEVLHHRSLRLHIASHTKSSPPLGLHLTGKDTSRTLRLSSHADLCSNPSATSNLLNPIFVASKFEHFSHLATMPSSPLRNQHITIIHPIECFVEKDWTPNQIEKWIKAAGGTPSSCLTDKTTHLVVSNKDWRLQGEVIQEALAKNQKACNPKRAKEIKILSGDWLRDELKEQKKVKESTYMWNKIEPRAIDGKGKKAAGDSKNHGGALHPSVMADLLTESTEQYLDPKEKKKLERQMREEERLRQEAEKEKENEARKRKDEVRKIVEDGRKKANQALFSGKLNTIVAIRKEGLADFSRDA